MQESSPTRVPSEATRARRQAKITLAPYVAKLSEWHPRTARLLLEVDRASTKASPSSGPGDAIRDLLQTVQRERQEFLACAANLKSTRVEDIEKSFERLLADLERAASRCPTSQ